MCPCASRCALLYARIATGCRITPWEWTRGGRSVHGSLGCTIRLFVPNTEESTTITAVAAIPATRIRRGHFMRRGDRTRVASQPSPCQTPAMPTVAELDIPLVDYNDPTLVGERFHEHLAELV